MIRYRRWPSMAAWRLLRDVTPRVRDMVLPYFERPKIKIKIRWDSYTVEAERMKAGIMEKHMLEAVWSTGIPTFEQFAAYLSNEAEPKP